MSISNLFKDCKYNNFTLKNRIAFLSRKTTKFSIEDSYATNLTFDFLDSNFLVEPINATYEENNEYNKRYVFSNTLTFSLNEQYDIFTLIDRFNRNKYYVCFESFDGSWYILNTENESEWSYNFNLSTNGISCEFTFSTLQNYPTVKLDVLPSISTLFINKECGYISTDIVLLQGIESKYIYVYKDENNDYRIDLLFALIKNINFNKNSLELTQTFSNNVFQTELTFNIPNDTYNWRYNLLKFKDNYYTFILTTNKNNNIIIEKVFPIFNQTNDQTQIILRSVSSTQNLYITDVDITVSNPDKWEIDYTEFIYENGIFYAKEYRWTWDETSSDYVKTTDYRKANALNAETRLEGVSCSNYNLMGTYQYILYGNLETGITFSEVITENSTDCGYVPPVSYGEIAFEFSTTPSGNAEFKLNETTFTATTSPYSAYVSDLIGEGVALTSLREMFRTTSNAYITKINSMPITKEVTSFLYCFSSCRELTSIENISDMDTSSATNMNNMFSGCMKLNNLDLSNFNTSKVTDMREMFGNCNALTTLDLSSFNTSNVTDMSNMFNLCEFLESVNVSSFDTSKVNTMSGMFSSCRKLTTLDLTSFNTEAVTDMSSMFSSCSELTTLDLSNFNVSNVTTMSRIFRSCSKVTELNLDNWILKQGVDVTSMFDLCNSLQTVYLRDSDNLTRVVIENALIEAGIASNVNLITNFL